MPYRSKKHTYLKKDIDSLFRDVFHDNCYISLTTLTEEDITNYKLSLIKKKDKTPKEVGNIFKNNIIIKQEYNTLKDSKSSKSNKRSKDDKKSKDVKTSKVDKTTKDNTSMDDEPAKNKKKDKTPKEVGNIFKNNITIKQEYDTLKDSKTSKSNKRSKDDKKSKDVKTSKVDKTTKDNTSMDDKPAKNIKKDKTPKEVGNIFKNNITIKQEYDTLKDSKTSKSNKRSKDDKKSKDVKTSKVDKTTKDNTSMDDEPAKNIKKDKTPKEVGNIFKNNITIKQEYDTLKDSKTSKSNKRSKDDKKSKDVKTSKVDKTTKDNTSMDDEPAKNKKKDKTPKEVGIIFKNNIIIKQEYDTLKDSKTSKSNKRSKDDKKSKDVKTSKVDKTTKDNTSMDDEPAKNKKKDKTPKEVGNIFKNNITIKQEYNTLKDSETSKSNKKSKDDKKFKDVKTSKVDKTTKGNTSMDDEPAKKKQKLDTNGIDVLKLVLYREGKTRNFKSTFKSSLKPKKEIAAISTAEEGPIVIDCEESTTSANSSATNVKQKIWPKDLKEMMDLDKYITWQKTINYSDKPNHLTNGMKKLAVAELPISGPKVTGLKHAVNGKKYVRGHLVKIEKLYIKYFSKSIQDTIVIIANILNIISMSNKHHKARMDESFKKKSEAEKLKERCDANRLHGRHKKVLETKFKNNFIDVVSSFEMSEFDSAFQMFFLSILTVLRVLDQSKFKKGSIFKNLVLLLWNSLKNSEYNNPKIFSMFRSKTFRPDCIDLISLIEDSRDIDSGVTDRMSLFFVSSVNSQEYFQAVIDAVTGDSNEDLGLLIDNAIFQCSVNSKFKDPVASPTAQYSDDKIPATETIPSTINSDEIIQQWFLAKNPDGTYQQIPLINGNNIQTIGNTAAKPSILTSQPLNDLYQSFSSSLQNKPSTSKVISTNKCFVVAPTISHSPLMQVTASLSKSTTPLPATTTTFVTFKPAVHNNISMPNNALQSAEGSTIVVGNRQYQLVKGPTGQMRAVINKTKTIVKPPSVVTAQCYARNCTKFATIMCSSCTSAKYCSHICQRLDWYNGHINDCERLLNQN